MTSNQAATSARRYVPSKDCINPWCRITWHQANSPGWKWLLLYSWFQIRFGNYAPACDHPNPFYRDPKDCMHCESIRLLEQGKKWESSVAHTLWCKATRSGLDETCPIHSRL